MVPRILNKAGSERPWKATDEIPVKERYSDLNELLRVMAIMCIVVMRISKDKLKPRRYEEDSKNLKRRMAWNLRWMEWELSEDWSVSNHGAKIAALCSTLPGWTSPLFFAAILPLHSTSPLNCAPMHQRPITKRRFIRS